MVKFDKGAPSRYVKLGCRSPESMLNLVIGAVSRYMLNLDIMDLSIS